MSQGSSPLHITVKEIQKRDGRVVPFDISKISSAIFKAADFVGESCNINADELATKVSVILEEEFDGTGTPSVEEIQDIVERVLIEDGCVKVAKEYILYREQRKRIRATRAALGLTDDLKLPLNSLTVLEKRYLQRNENREVLETPRELFQRVAHAVALGDKKFGAGKKDIEKTELEFFELMTSFKFLPNSPTLMNAGTDLGQLSACFVLPVDDSLEGIFDSIKYTALIHQSGGGTGFSFSRLRPEGDVVRSSGGVASGPISFMSVFDAATNVIKQGGRRRGANMGILRVDHPDIMNFIVCKQKEGTLANFNISVAITDKFMKALEDGTDYELINPHTKKVSGTLSAQTVFDMITNMAWNNGEPGVIFIDSINKRNPTPQLGEIESTNPCGEQPLLPYESCNLGSINLGKFVKDKAINWEDLDQTVRNAVHFLDNVIEQNKYPLLAIRDMAYKTRKIGLGVMGFADMLVTLRIPYNSESGVKMAKKLMSFIQETALEESSRLGKERGSFPAFAESPLAKNWKHMRNATVTTIAPTGTIGIIANTSSGVEPLFALAYVRSNVLDNDSLVEVNRTFEKMAKENNFYNNDLIAALAQGVSLAGMPDVPAWIKEVFVTSHQITPEWHIRMQAAFQKFTDNAVSKTINFPNSATVEQVREAYLTAYKLGCKGLTIYRDGSRDMQVLTVGVKQESTFPLASKIKECPKCKVPLESKEGCSFCPKCGYSDKCSLS